MLDQLLSAAGSQLLGTGLVGAFCVFLLWYISKKEQESKDKEKAHKEELATKDKFIQELQNSRLQEVRSITEIVATNKSVIESNNVLASRLASLVEELLATIATAQEQNRERRQQRVRRRSNNASTQTEG